MKFKEILKPENRLLNVKPEPENTID